MGSVADRQFYRWDPGTLFLEGGAKQGTELHKKCLKN